MTIAWTVEPADDGKRRLSLVWTDSVCAEKQRRPAGTGFGTKLISQLVEKKHAGTITVESDADLQLPDRVHSSPTSQPPAL